MTTIHTFTVQDLGCQPVRVDIRRLDDSSEYIVSGPDDLNETHYPPALADATRREPMPLDDALALAADVAAECSGLAV